MLILNSAKWKIAKLFHYKVYYLKLVFPLFFTMTCTCAGHWTDTMRLSVAPDLLSSNEDTTISRAQNGVKWAKMRQKLLVTNGTCSVIGFEVRLLGEFGAKMVENIVWRWHLCLHESPDIRSVIWNPFRMYQGRRMQYNFNRSWAEHILF